jgi:Helix-turn-helix domain
VIAAVCEHGQAGSPALVVDVHGAMKMLQLGRTTVMALAASGELPRLKAGRATRFAIADIQHLIKRMQAGEVLDTRGG